MEIAEIMQKLVDEFNRIGIEYEKAGVTVDTFIVSCGEKRTYITFFGPVLDISSYWFGTRMASISFHYSDIERIFFDDDCRRLFVTLVGSNYATIDL